MCTPRFGHTKNYGDRKDDKEWLKPDIGREIYSFAHAIAHQAQTKDRQNPAEPFGPTGSDEVSYCDVSKKRRNENVAIGFGSRIEDGKN